jgi:hypothetical protein
VEFDISVKFSKECEGSFRLRSPADEERQQQQFLSTLTYQGGSSTNNSENDWTYGPEIRKEDREAVVPFLTPRAGATFRAGRSQTRPISIRK